jgi:transposase
LLRSAEQHADQSLVEVGTPLGRTTGEEGAVQVVHERCCGLDVHKKVVAACVLTPGVGGQPRKEVRTFGTMTEDLERLADWLAERGVGAVAMESTGSYWKPIWNILEERRFALVLANAQHVKHVPGRKTDVKDAEWLAELLRHGLLRGSFVPDKAQRELRELTRYRTSLVEERTAAVNRLQKVLEGANVKLASVATDVTGVSARAMLAELVAGSTDAAASAQLAVGQLRAKIPELQRALTGRVGAHQRFLLAQQLAHLDFLDEQIARLDAEVAERTRPFEAAIARLDTIPGVSRRVAEILVAEIGTALDRFPTPGHLASWAGMCPGNHESAGKRRSGATRKGSPALRRALVQAAHATGRTKSTYLGAQYRRLSARRGTKRAAVAVGHSILVIAFHLLARSSAYQDLGPGYFDERDRDAVRRRLVGRLEKLGYKVTTEPVAA